MGLWVAEHLERGVAVVRGIFAAGAAQGEVIVAAPVHPATGQSPAPARQDRARVFPGIGGRAVRERDTPRRSAEPEGAMNDHLVARPHADHAVRHSGDPGAPGSSLQVPATEDVVPGTAVRRRADGAAPPERIGIWAAVPAAGRWPPVSGAPRAGHFFHRPSGARARGLVRRFLSRSQQTPKPAGRRSRPLHAGRARPGQGRHHRQPGDRKRTPTWTRCPAPECTTRPGRGASAHRAPAATATTVTCWRPVAGVGRWTSTPRDCQ
jgi:hypothetical protein